MGKLDDAFERTLSAFARRASGRTVTAVVFLLYPGVALLLPLALGWTVAWLVAANVAGACLAVSVMLAWLVERLRGRDRRLLVEWTSDLRMLDAHEFEWLVGEVYRRDGWRVEEVGRHGSPDGNVDLRLTRGAATVAVQCKRWVAWQIGVDEVRSFAGALMRDGLTGDAGVIVTLRGFTDQARTEAQAMGLALLDSRDLLERINAVRRAEPCPTCGAPMILDRSVRGWWFRCLATGCSGKRDLGRDPARAVELLTETAA
jgi:hypothetical protein